MSIRIYTQSGHIDITNDEARQKLQHVRTIKPEVLPPRRSARDPLLAVFIVACLGVSLGLQIAIWCRRADARFEVTRAAICTGSGTTASPLSCRTTINGPLPMGTSVTCGPR